MNKIFSTQLHVCHSIIQDKNNPEVSRFEKFFTLEAILKKIETGGTNLPVIEKARLYDRNHAVQEKKYTALKLFKSEAVLFACHIDGETEKINGLTGLLYADADRDELLKAQLTVGQFKEILLQKYPFVIAAWNSFSGTAVGFLISINNVNNKDEYRQCYRQIEKLFKDDLNLMLDAKCKNPNRFNALSYDSSILINSNPQSFEYNPANNLPEPEYKDKYKDIPPDSSLHYDEQIYEGRLRLFKEYYNSYTLVSLLTGLPVPFTEQLEFNPSIHYLTKEFETHIISQMPVHNEDSTLGYSWSPIAAVRIEIYPEMKIRHMKRAKTIKNILSNYLYITSRIEFKHITKNILFNCALVLNLRCTDKSGKEPFPLDQLELNKMVCQVWAKHIEGNLTLSIKQRKTVLNKKFFAKYDLNVIGRRKKPLLIMQETNKLIHQHSDKDFREKLKSVITSFKESNILPTQKQVAEKLQPMLNSFLEINTIRNKLSKGDNKTALVHHFPYMNTHTKYRKLVAKNQTCYLTEQC